MSKHHRIKTAILAHIAEAAGHGQKADTLAQIGEHLFCTTPTVQRAVRALVIEGAIAIEGDRHHRRYLHTATGRHTAWRHARSEAVDAETLRPCICCRTEFPSEGPHNRMCTRCRSEASEALPAFSCRRNGMAMAGS